MGQVSVPGWRRVSVQPEVSKVVKLGLCMQKAGPLRKLGGPWSAVSGVTCKHVHFPCTKDGEKEEFEQV